MSIDANFCLVVICFYLSADFFCIIFTLIAQGAAPLLTAQQPGTADERGRKLFVVFRLSALWAKWSASLVLFQRRNSLVNRRNAIKLDRP